MAGTKPKNVSAWRLNAAEKEEVASRKAAGEDEAAVKHEIRLRKAEANEARKRAAQAVVATVGGAAAPVGRGQTAAQSSAEAQTIGEGSVNHEYYQEVKAALQKILSEFPGIEGQAPLPFNHGAGAAGVQDPYSKLNGAAALEAHGVCRCSVSLFALNLLSSPTPDIPMSARRVHDMTSFFYGSGPKFLTDKQVEVCATSSTDLPETPSMLQMVSPEEIAHAMVFGCAGAIG